MISIIIATVITVALASVYEGLLHQFVLHTPQKKVLWGALKPAFRAHALEHHPQFRDEVYHHEPDHTDSRISLGWYTLPLTLLIFSPLIVGARFLLGWPSALAVVLTLCGYYVMYEALHWSMHFPGKDARGRFFRRYWPLKQIFEWFDKRHFVHHLADDRNFNVVLPVYDLLVGRYSTDIASIPWAIRRRRRRAIAKSGDLREQLRSTKQDA